MPPTDRRILALGVAAALVTVLIWASWILSTRYAVTGRFSIAELMLMRFPPAALLLLPVLLKRGFWPREARWGLVVLVIACSGPGFVLTMVTGMSLAPASDAGALAPGTLPLFVALASALWLGERFTPVRLAGFAMIVFGGLVVGGGELLANAQAGAWRGHLLFLAASSIWAVFTVAFRLSGLSALHAAALTAFWSSVALLPVLPFAGISFDGAEWGEVAVMTLEQGIVVGVIALLTYGSAVTMIGPSRTAAFAALAPVLALAGGVALLGETLTPMRVAGVLVVALGVVLASGVFTLRRRAEA